MQGLRLGLIGLLIAGVPLLAQHQELGFFSEEQAQRGRAVYGEACAECHGADLDGGVAPSLVGEDFRRRWEHPRLTADDLFYLVRTTMPPTKRSSLSADDYVAVVAWMLSENGYPTGDEPLGADAESLRQVPLNLGDLVPVASKPVPEVIEGKGSPSGGPTQAELSAAAERTDAWLYNTKSYDGSRFVPLAQINVENANKLQALCAFQVGEPTTSRVVRSSMRAFST